MTQLASIAAALSFIEDRLREPITVADIADAGGYSLYHFCRLFNHATHHTPYNYLIRRRLAEATRALVTTEARVIDIALDYQFNNPETFSRACARTYEASPTELRAAGYLDPHRLLPPLSRAHLAYLDEHREQLRPLFVQRQSLTLSGLMAWLERDAPCPLLERRFEALLATCKDDLSRRADRYLLRWYPPDWARHGIGYLVAVRSGEIPPAPKNTPFVQKPLPAGPYVGFRHAGPPETFPLLLDYVHHTWLPNAKRTLAAPFVLEHREAGGTTLFFPLAPA